MSKPLTYRPFNGLEYAFRPDIVDRMHDEQQGGTVESEAALDLSGLRPAHTEERVNTILSRRGKYVFTTTTTTTIITNRPIATNPNTTGGTQS
jgi:hypothetical protein